MVPSSHVVASKPAGVGARPTHRAVSSMPIAAPTAICAKYAATSASRSMGSATSTSSWPRLAHSAAASRTAAWTSGCVARPSCEPVEKAMRSVRGARWISSTYGRSRGGDA